MLPQGFIRQIRSVLENTSDFTLLSDLLLRVDDFVLEVSSSSQPLSLLALLEEELHVLHRDSVGHSSLSQTNVFLAVLYHLGPILSSTSIISWFDIVLRPALREPRLPTAATNHAKELIIVALQKREVAVNDRIDAFRRRLFDLYLLDAYNEGSGDDVLEWADLPEEQREKRTHWKTNLEDILMKYGIQQPQDLMKEIHIHFATPSSRLQLLMLLNMLSSKPDFESASAILASHPLMTSLLSSLLLDNSSTVCTAGLTLLVKLLPVFAVHSREHLRSTLPHLFAILARILCWKERYPANDMTDYPPDFEFERELAIEGHQVLPIRAELNWARLELTFTGTASSAPSPRALYTILYYLYPCNLLAFMRAPVDFLSEKEFASPFFAGWAEVIDMKKLRLRGEGVLREHICHPILAWRNAASELVEPEFWSRYNAARITSEAFMLNIHNTAVGILEREGGVDRLTALSQPSTPLDSSPPPSEDSDDERVVTTDLRPSWGPWNGKIKVSLQDMINTSIALKSNLQLEVAQSSSQWPRELYPTARTPSSEFAPSLSSSSIDQTLPTHVAQAISALQREVLLLRNDLNFELWLSRENVKHIGRLYQDHILTKSAEAERQGLYNKLRKYRAQVIGLETELREHKTQASSTKNKYADWNRELGDRLKEFREEKKTWISEATTLRNAEKETKALFVAQGKLLAEATKQVFELQTQKKETQHKVDRLRDYERQLEQHVRMQRLWDSDFAKFNERADMMNAMESQIKQMHLRLESSEKHEAEMEAQMRTSRRQIQTLEMRLAQLNRTQNISQPTAYMEIAAFAAEKAEFANTTKRLRGENADLREELEELRAMVEVLKGQHTGRRGLISEPRASPVLYA